MVRALAPLNLALCQGRKWHSGLNTGSFAWLIVTPNKADSERDGWHCTKCPSYGQIIYTGLHTGVLLQPVLKKQHWNIGCLVSYGLVPPTVSAKGCKSSLAMSLVLMNPCFPAFSHVLEVQPCRAQPEKAGSLPAMCLRYPPGKVLPRCRNQTGSA